MSSKNASASSAGLRGQSVGSTAICTVGKKGTGLTYRGYPIEELGSGASFEEAAYLLIYGDLPNRSELDEFFLRLKQKRQLPVLLKQVLELIPAEAHPMDVLRTGCSFLGSIEPEISFDEERNIAHAFSA